MFLQMDMGEKPMLECSGGVQQGGALGLVVLFLPLQPVLPRVWEEYGSQGV